jgi:hypothetical protein
MADLTTLAWPGSRLGEALEALARAAGLAPHAVDPLSPPAGLPWHGDEALGRWLAAAAGHLGLEAEPTPIPYGEVERLLQQARQARLPSRLFALVGGHAVQYLLWLLAWWMVGQGALQGRFDPGWLLAWALLLVTLVPFRLLATWSQGRLAIGVGGSSSSASSTELCGLSRRRSAIREPASSSGAPSRPRR